MRSALHATTPFPNVLLDNAMPRLKDTEWRVLCVIVRQTLGHYDHATKARKERDWITRAQLTRRTGRNTEALALAMAALVSGGYVTACNGKGQPLSTPAARRKNHGRIYYGLSHAWKEKLDYEHDESGHLKTEHSIIEQSHPKSSPFTSPTRKTELVSTGKPDTTKETLTKENKTKETGDPNSLIVRNVSNAPGRWNPSRQGEESSVEKPSVRTVAREVFSSPSENGGEQVKRFIAVFENLSKEYDHGNPNTKLSFSDATRLKTLLEKHAALDWTPFLQMFFQSDLSYVIQRTYSLPAFLNTCNVFLCQRPTKPASRRQSASVQSAGSPAVNSSVPNQAKRKRIQVLS